MKKNTNNLEHISRQTDVVWCKFSRCRFCVFFWRYKI